MPGDGFANCLIEVAIPQTIEQNLTNGVGHSKIESLRNGGGHRQVGFCVALDLLRNRFDNFAIAIRTSFCANSIQWTRDGFN